jgi:leucyl aminopeptidase
MRSTNGEKGGPLARSGQVSPPEIALRDGAPTAVVGADVVAVPVLQDDSGLLLGPGAAELVDELDTDVFALLEHEEATGAVGEVVALPVLDPSHMTNPQLQTVLLVGVGRGSARDLRRAGAVVARRTKGKGVVATSLAALADDDGLVALVEGLVLGSFGFHRRSTDPESLPVRQVVLAGVPDPTTRRAALERAMAVAGAGWLARTLALVPSNEKNPSWMVDRAGELAAASGLQLEVWDQHRLAEDGFGGIVGVGQASVNPPRLVQLDYTPPKGGRRAPRVVLVGKGITFDTGGLSIKPADNMMTMKRDMTGAGVVLAVMGALAEIGCRVRVTGLLPLAENSISGSSLRPGDVLRQYGGRTTEVTNTDAEGRLVMADALGYAAARLRPRVLVDIATLTGAVKVALGQRTGGLFATDDALADQLLAAGEEAGERVWRLPLVDDYEDLLESKIADADNAPTGPGGVIAALFLRHFTAGLPWAHLDIASVGDAPADSYEWTQGATGFGARLLLRWLGSDDPLAGIADRPATKVRGRDRR